MPVGRYKSLLKFFVDITIIGERVHAKLQHIHIDSNIVLSNFCENGNLISAKQIAGMAEDG